MSGHSKWSKIKRTKEVSDKKRGQLFTKLGRAITVAAQEKGGDLAMNFKLKLAVEQARAANMPKETIARAIARGAGEKSEKMFEEIVYEGFGPEGAALIIQALTDNKNRTGSEIKHILANYGGRLGVPGSVMWQFKKTGTIRLSLTSSASSLNKDSSLELLLIDAGAEDIRKDEDGFVIYTKPEKLQGTEENLKKAGIKSESAEIEYIPLQTIQIKGQKERECLQKLLDALDGHGDVSGVYTNAK